MLKVLRNSVFVFLLFVFGCNPSVNNEKEFINWLGDSDNGFVKKARANGFLLSMKHLPTAYLALNEMKKDEVKDMQLFQDYKNKFKDSKTFLLTITNDDEAINAANYGVYSIQEYNQRIKDLSFNIKELMSLKTSTGKKYHPVLTTMENVYEVANKKAIYMVFSDDHGDITNSEQFDVVFNDEFLGTGISHFVFEGNKINNLPIFNF